jgi:hypothetical protein
LPSEAFSYRSKDELKQMSLFELNVYLAELRRRAKWVSGASLKSLEQHLAEGVKARDEKRAQG